MSLWKREEVQEMPRCRGLIRLFLCAASLATVFSYARSPGNDDALWREFGLVEKTSATLGSAHVTLYRMKDLTGAVAAWEWRREPAARPCDLETFCSANGKRSVIASANYLLELDGPVAKPRLDAFLQTLPNRRDSSLPAIFTYLPRKNLIPNSRRSHPS
jgi:hypothetical protein